VFNDAGKETTDNASNGKEYFADNEIWRLLILGIFL
jgi:hypothetical protein